MKKINKLSLIGLMTLLLGGCQFNINDFISTNSSSSSNETLSTSSVNSIEEPTNSNSSTLSSLSSSSSSSITYVEKSLLITPSNFNKLSELVLDGVVENTDYPEEFTFNSNAVMKSNKLTGLKEIKIHAYSTYENLLVYQNYTGSGTNLTSKKETLDKAAKYTYTLNGGNEFYIVNSSSTHRTHVYSIEIKYMATSSSGNNNSSSSSSNSSSSSSSSSSSNSSSSNVQLSGNYTGTYYSNISTSTNGKTLVEELSKLINSNTSNVGYDGLKDAYKTTDVKPGTNILWDMYSNCSYQAGSSFVSSYSKEGDGYNREHSVPQSWFNEASPMKSDLFHVYPTDGYVNGRRGNYPFGEVKSETYTSGNGSKLGSSANSLYSGTVFEPIDEYKGDFARTYFYMATRYMSKLGSWTKGEAQKVFSSSYPYLTAYSVDLFTKWAEQDPVSQKEIDRNNAVYKLQKNRNPYIDHPEFVEIIWG